MSCPGRVTLSESRRCRLCGGRMRVDELAASWDDEDSLRELGPYDVAHPACWLERLKAALDPSQAEFRTAEQTAVLRRAHATWIPIATQGRKLRAELRQREMLRSATFG